MAFGCDGACKPVTAADEGERRKAAVVSRFRVTGEDGRWVSRLTHTHTPPPGNVRVSTLPLCCGGGQQLHHLGLSLGAGLVRGPCGALPPHGICLRDLAGACLVRGLMIGGRVRCMTPPPWRAAFLGFPGVKSGETRCVCLCVSDMRSCRCGRAPVSPNESNTRGVGRGEFERTEAV